MAKTAEIAGFSGLEGFTGCDTGSDPSHEAAEVTDAGRVVEISPVQLATGRWSRWIAIAGGFGYVPVAPGTAGSFAGVLVFWLVGIGAVAAGVSETSFVALYALAVGSLLLIGVHAAGRAEIDFGRRDDGRIVIDEVVGQLIALAPLVPLLWAIEGGAAAAPGFQTAHGALLADGALSADSVLSMQGLSTGDVSLFFFEVVTGFVLFRLFDVWKPGAIRWAERRFGGGLGVMADDVVAGIYAALCLFLLHTLVFERFYSGLLIASRPELSDFRFGVSL